VIIVILLLIIVAAAVWFFFIRDSGEDVEASLAALAFVCGAGPPFKHGVTPRRHRPLESNQAEC